LPTGLTPPLFGGLFAPEADPALVGEAIECVKKVGTGRGVTATDTGGSAEIAAADEDIVPDLRVLSLPPTALLAKLPPSARKDDDADDRQCSRNVS
jgi:hypothetical protein